MVINGEMGAHVIGEVADREDQARYGRCDQYQWQESDHYGRDTCEASVSACRGDPEGEDRVGNSSDEERPRCNDYYASPSSRGATHDLAGHQPSRSGA